MDWTEKKRREAEKTLKRWVDMVFLGPITLGRPPQEVLSPLMSDLNTPGAIAALHQLYNEGRHVELGAALHFLGFDLSELSGLTNSRENWELHTSEVEGTKSLIEALLEERDVARVSRDFERADEIRDGLSAAGVLVTDKAGGASWEKAENFDPSKLEALK